uniref:Uncharacterized protein n=1 Tax=Anguilla anguilla TaxID=7936 RepID=A0A0E9SN05_ANGAN
MDLERKVANLPESDGFLKKAIRKPATQLCQKVCLTTHISTTFPTQALSFKTCFYTQTVNTHLSVPNLRKCLLRRSSDNLR